MMPDMNSFFRINGLGTAKMIPCSAIYGQKFMIGKSGRSTLDKNAWSENPIAQLWTKMRGREIRGLNFGQKWLLGKSGCSTLNKNM
jgi:hypothetical protein